MMTTSPDMNVRKNIAPTTAPAIIAAFLIESSSANLITSVIGTSTAKHIQIIVRAVLGSSSGSFAPQLGQSTTAASGDGVWQFLHLRDAGNSMVTIVLRFAERDVESPGAAAGRLSPARGRCKAPCRQEY